jgi:hypothetical protein
MTKAETVMEKIAKTKKKKKIIPGLGQRKGMGVGRIPGLNQPRFGARSGYGIGRQLGLGCKIE